MHCSISHTTERLAQRSRMDELVWTGHVSTFWLLICCRTFAGVPPAVALSQATMAASALAGAFANALMPHPDNPSKPVVDYNLGLVLSPGMLMGSSIGKQDSLRTLASGAGTGCNLETWNSHQVS